jgi:hypothetical protein
MAVSLVNATFAFNGSFSSNLTVTIPSTAAGNTLIAMTSCDDINNNSGGVTSTTDNLSSAGWTRLLNCKQNVGSTGTANFIDIWYLPNIATGITSVTSNYAGTLAAGTTYILEVSGIDRVSPVIASNGGTFSTSGSPHNGTAISSGAIANAFYVAVANPTASGAVFTSAANGWTSLVRNPGGAVWFEYLIATGSQTPGFNGGATVSYPLSAAVFKPSTTTPNLFCMF